MVLVSAGRILDARVANIPNVEESRDSEDKEAPLVGAGSECANEPTDDDDPGHEAGSEDIGEREASGEKDEQKKQWERDKPLDVADILPE